MQISRVCFFSDFNLKEQTAHYQRIVLLFGVKQCFFYYAHERLLCQMLVVMLSNWRVNRAVIGCIPPALVRSSDQTKGI